jgi:uncharacterized membrane protein YphA (DoxX/SURF4 family)
MVSAFLFLQFGTAKLFALPGPIMPDGGTAAVGSLPWVAGALETVGGPLLLLGLFTRPVAFLLSGEMAVAYSTVTPEGQLEGPIPLLVVAGRFVNSCSFQEGRSSE